MKLFALLLALTGCAQAQVSALTPGQSMQVTCNPSPVITPTPVASPTPSPTPIASPTPRPTPSPLPVPSVSPSPSPIPSPTPTPTPTPTIASSAVPTLAANWDVPYTGFGSVTFAASGVTLMPKASTIASETHAALALAKVTETKPLLNFTASFRVTDLQQLRTPTPNGWESFWLFFNYVPDATGKKKTNYLAFKPVGLELGTAFDELGQTFLATNSTQSKIGQSYLVSVTKVGTTITVRMDGVIVMNTTNAGIYNVAGAIGLYTEDAKVLVSDVSIQQL